MTIDPRSAEVKRSPDHWTPSGPPVKSWMWIFPKVIILETFVRVKKLLERRAEKIKDFFIGARYELSLFYYLIFFQSAITP